VLHQRPPRSRPRGGSHRTPCSDRSRSALPSTFDRRGWRERGPRLASSTDALDRLKSERHLEPDIYARARGHSHAPSYYVCPPRRCVRDCRIVEGGATATLFFLFLFLVRDRRRPEYKGKVLARYTDRSDHATSRLDRSVRRLPDRSPFRAPGLCARCHSTSHDRYV